MRGEHSIVESHHVCREIGSVGKVVLCDEIGLRLSVEIVLTRSEPGDNRCADEQRCYILIHDLSYRRLEGYIKTAGECARQGIDLAETGTVFVVGLDQLGVAHLREVGDIGEVLTRNVDTQALDIEAACEVLGQSVAYGHVLQAAVGCVLEVAVVAECVVVLAPLTRG